MAWLLQSQSSSGLEGQNIQVRSCLLVVLCRLWSRSLAPTVATLTQKLDLGDVDVVAVAGFAALGLIGSAAEPAFHINLLTLGQMEME